MHKETWGTFDDNKASDLDVGARQGDLRAAMAPFLANITFRTSHLVSRKLSDSAGPLPGRPCIKSRQNCATVLLCSMAAVAQLLAASTHNKH